MRLLLFRSAWCNVRIDEGSYAGAPVGVTDSAPFGGWTRDDLRRAGAELAARSRADQGLSERWTDDPSLVAKVRNVFAVGEAGTPRVERTWISEVVVRLDFDTWRASPGPGDAVTWAFVG